jgi:hypothetical protein
MNLHALCYTHEMRDGWCLLFSSNLSYHVCVCVSGTTVESRCPHACTNLFKILRLFLSSLEELISEFRLCLSSVYHMIYLTIHVKEAWTSLIPLPFWLLCYNFVNDNVQVLRTIFDRRGIIWENNIWENKPRLFIKQNRQLQLWSVDLISFFYWIRYLYK